VTLEERLSDAVRYYWKTRLKQKESQGAGSGVRDYGARADVTGGKHMDGFANLICDLVRESGMSAECIFKGSKTDLPGFFRPAKDWDLIVVADQRLLALMELKSQAGPSYGNNCNNRVEEALGNATDLWTAFREKTFGKSKTPWAGYIMLLEEDERSTSPVRVAEPHFNIRSEFKDVAYEKTRKSVSYATRYELLCRKLVLERLYTSACLILTSREGGLHGEYREPASDLRFSDFVASLIGKLAEYQKAKELEGRKQK
jgi:Restriction endonuclease XhoI